ncbi:hypothetical protein JCM1841_005898 [Sporobolomyces salmonicolor]
MGRRKISIAPIQDDRNRQVTFLKRKNGLFKKAYELGVLCSADVAVVVFNANGKLFEFHSGDMDTILLRYSHYAGPPHEKRGPEDYLNKDLAAAAAKGNGGKMTTLSDGDDDDDDGDEPPAALPPTGSSGVRVNPQGRGTQEGRGKQAVLAARERERRGVSANPSANASGGGVKMEGEEMQGGVGTSLSRPGSQSNGHHQSQQQHLQLHAGLAHPQHPYPGSSQQQQQYGTPNLAFPLPPSQPAVASTSQPQPPQQQPYPGYPPSSTLPPHHLQFGMLPPPPPPPPPPGMSGMPNFNFPGLAMAGMPNFAAGMPGLSFGGAPGQGGFGFGFMGGGGGGGGEGASGAGGAGSGGVPSWFGAQNPTATAEQGYPPPQPPQPPPPPQSQPQPPPPRHPTSSSSYDEAQLQPLSRPASVASMASQHSLHSQSHQSHSSPRSHPPPSLSSRSNSLSHSQSLQKPRLSVSIPSHSAASHEENRKAGLVTAGGASILGGAMAGGGGAVPGGGMVDEPEGMEGYEGGDGAGKEGRGREEDEDESGQPTAVPRSAFASDLLPSPFYPSASHPLPSSSSSNSNPYAYAFPYSLPYPSAAFQQPPPQSSFTWPSATTPSVPRPAPMLGAEEEPDLLRPGSPAEAGLSEPAAAATGGNEGRGEAPNGAASEVRRLKRGSVDLEEDFEGMAVVESEAGDGEESEAVAEDGARDGRTRKRRA